MDFFFSFKEYTILECLEAQTTHYYFAYRFLTERIFLQRISNSKVFWRRKFCLESNSWLPETTFVPTMWTQSVIPRVQSFKTIIYFPKEVFFFFFFNLTHLKASLYNRKTALMMSKISYLPLVHFSRKCKHMQYTSS